MTRNRRIAVILCSLSAIAAGCTPLLLSSDTRDSGDVVRGMVVGISLVLAVALLIKSKNLKTS